MELPFTAFSARLAVLLARRDETGIESLSRTFVRANGAGGPELVDELMGLARALVAMFEQHSPGVLETILVGLEDDIGGQLDDDG